MCAVITMQPVLGEVAANSVSSVVTVNFLNLVRAPNSIFELTIATA